MHNRKTAYNSKFAIGGVSCSADTFVVAESFVLRINISGKNPRPSQICQTLQATLNYYSAKYEQTEKTTRQPTLRKIKRGVLHTHLPPQKHHI